MAGLLEDALSILLDGIKSREGLPGDAAELLKTLGFAAPEGARPVLDSILQKIDAIPSGLGIDSQTGLAKIHKLVDAIGRVVSALQTEPLAFAETSRDYGLFLVAHLPRRLVDHVSVTQAEKRVPLLAGLLRFAGIFNLVGPEQPRSDFELDVLRHQVDLDQLVLLLTDPPRALRWGQTDFKDEAVVWGLEDIIRAARGEAPLALDQRLRLSIDAEESLLERRPDDESAAAAVSVPEALIRLAALHEQGLVATPLEFSINLGNGRLIKNLTGFDPEMLENPGVAFGPGGLRILPRAGTFLPGTNDG